MNSAVPCVAHIIYSLKAGGLENGLVNIINRIPETRYRHVIICLTDADQFAERISVDSVEIFQLHKKPGHDLMLYIRLWQLLRKLKPAVVHTRNLSSLEMQFVAFLVPGIKRVHGEHGRDIDDLEGKNRKYNFLRKAMRLFVQRYIAVSEDLSYWLKATVAVPEKRVVQIYNGVDHAKFTGGQRNVSAVLPGNFKLPDVLVVGTVGRLAAVKNQISLVRAFHRAVLDAPELADRLRLVLVGDGPMRLQIETEIESLGLSGSIWLAGNRDDIPQLLQAMDIFVLPSLGEGVSNTILEAMATGLPILATNVGGNPELVRDGENGMLVAVDDDDALATAILSLAKSPELRAAMGARSSERVTQSFNWDKTVDRYMSVYDELLGIASS